MSYIIINNKERSLMMSKKQCFAFFVLIFLTVLCTMFIWSNSMLGGEGSGALSKTVTEFLCDIIGDLPQENFEQAHHFVRKAAHFTEFALLGVLYTLIKNKLDKKSVSTLLFFPVSCTLFTAVTDEFIQSFTGRGSSVRDVMLDFAGAITGILLTVILTVIIKKCYRKSRKM